MTRRSRCTSKDAALARTLRRYMAARSAVDGYTKKVAGFTCHEILPNFGNQTVILELIRHTQKRYNGH